VATQLIKQKACITSLASVALTTTCTEAPPKLQADSNNRLGSMAEQL